MAPIDHAEREIADQARNIEPGEEEGVADKIEALAAGWREVDNAAIHQGLDSFPPVTTGEGSFNFDRNAGYLASFRSGSSSGSRNTNIEL